MRTCYLEPITLECLAAATENIGYSTSVLVGNISVEELNAAIEQIKPVAVGFSVYTYAYEESLLLAREAKHKAKEMGYELFTIFGGCHPSALPEMVASEPDVDFVVIGEGEATLCELLDTLRKKEDFTKVAGLAFKQKGKFIRTTPRNRIENLDILPLPKRFPEHLGRARQYQIAYPPPSKQVMVAQVTYSRGCPFSCAFCSSESTWGRQVFWRSPKLVLDEIEMLVKTFGTNLVYFPDLTFNVSREKVLEVCSEFKTRRLPVHWWALFRADMLDEELLEKLVEANCVKLSLGLESPNEVIAKNVKGAYHTRKVRLSQILNAADSLGLIIKAFLMIGFVNETQDTIRAYKDELLSLPIDELRVTIVTPFPGTRLWNQSLSQGLLPSPPEWNRFTTDRLVIYHPNMTGEELLTVRRELVNGFYLDPLYASRVQSKLRKFPHLCNAWSEYFRFLEAKGVFSGNENEFQHLMTALQNIASEMQLSKRESIQTVDSTLCLE